MPKSNKIKIRKEEGRNIRFYDVYTAEYIDRILSGGGVGRGDGTRGRSDDDGVDLGGGFGQKIGIITEDLNGLVQTFDVRLDTAISAGRDYLVRNQEGNVYSFTPENNVQVGVGTVDLGDDETIIIALSGSGIYEQTPQQEAENREFRERILGLRENLDTLNLELEELNEDILPELNTKLGTLTSYFEDPNNIPEDFDFFTGIVTNEIWAQTGVFMEGWFGSVFTNALMADRIITNHIGAGQVVASKIDTADLAATLAFIQKLFAQEIALVLDTSVSPAKGGLIRSTNWNGAVNSSNQITGFGTQGFAIDYSGNSVFHNTFIRGTIQSANFVAGESGWEINNSGNAEFDNVLARGRFLGEHGGSVPSGDNLQSSNFVTGISGWRIQGTGDVEFRNGIFRGQILITGGNAAKNNEVNVTIPYFYNLSEPLANSLPTQRQNGDPLITGDIAVATNTQLAANRLWNGSAWVLFDQYSFKTPITIRSSTAPTNRGEDYEFAPIEKGDTWIDTSSGSDDNSPRVYDGRTPFSVDGWIRNYTRISGGNITTGTVDADRIDVVALFSKELTIETGGFIKSKNYVEGSTGYRLLSNVADFEDITLKGQPLNIGNTINPPKIFAVKHFAEWTGSGTKYTVNWTRGETVQNSDRIEIIYYRGGSIVGTKTGILTTGSPDVNTISGGSSGQLVYVVVNLTRGGDIFDSIQTREDIQAT
jgi:hypothetical protein